MRCWLVLNITKRLLKNNNTKKHNSFGIKKEPMCAWGDLTLLYLCTHTHTHSRRKQYTHTHLFTFSLVCTNAPTPLCICINPRKRTHRSTPSGADQLFSCGRRSQLRHLKRTERSAWRRLPLLWFFTLRRSISLMQSCRALASIKSNIYQEIKRGERERG